MSFTIATPVPRPLAKETEMTRKKPKRPKVGNFISDAMFFEHELKVEKIKLEIDCLQQQKRLVEKQQHLADLQLALVTKHLSSADARQKLVGSSSATPDPVETSLPTI